MMFAILCVSQSFFPFTLNIRKDQILGEPLDDDEEFGYSQSKSRNSGHFNETLLIVISNESSKLNQLLRFKVSHQCTDFEFKLHSKLTITRQLLGFVTHHPISPPKSSPNFFLPQFCSSVLALDETQIHPFAGHELSILAAEAD